MTLSDRLELELELELVEQTTPPGHLQAQQTGDIFSGHTATPPPHQDLLPEETWKYHSNILDYFG